MSTEEEPLTKEFVQNLINTTNDFFSSGRLENLCSVNSGVELTADVAKHYFHDGLLSGPKNDYKHVEFNIVSTIRNHDLRYNHSGFFTHLSNLYSGVRDDIWMGNNTSMHGYASEYRLNENTFIPPTTKHASLASIVQNITYGYDDPYWGIIVQGINRFYGHLDYAVIPDWAGDRYLKDSRIGFSVAYGGPYLVGYADSWFHLDGSGFSPHLNIGYSPCIVESDGLNVVKMAPVPKKITITGLGQMEFYREAADVIFVSGGGANPDGSPSGYTTIGPYENELVRSYDLTVFNKTYELDIFSWNASKWWHGYGGYWWWYDNYRFNKDKIPAYTLEYPIHFHSGYFVDDYNRWLNENLHALSYNELEGDLGDISENLIISGVIDNSIERLWGTLSNGDQLKGYIYGNWWGWNWDWGWGNGWWGNGWFGGRYNYYSWYGSTNLAEHPWYGYGWWHGYNSYISEPQPVDNGYVVLTYSKTTAITVAGTTVKLDYYEKSQIENEYHISMSLFFGSGTSYIQDEPSIADGSIISGVYLPSYNDIQYTPSLGNPVIWGGNPNNIKGSNNYVKGGNYITKPISDEQLKQEREDATKASQGKVSIELHEPLYLNNTFEFVHTESGNNTFVYYQAIPVSGNPILSSVDVWNTGQRIGVQVKGGAQGHMDVKLAERYRHYMEFN